MRLLILLSILTPLLHCAETDAAGPRLVVKEPTRLLGTVYTGQPITVQFQLHNSGNQSLQIRQIGLGCGCAAENRSWTEQIAPGEQGVIDLKLDPAELRNGAGPFAIPVTVFANDAISPKTTLWIRGQLQRNFTIDPGTSLRFTRMSADEPKSPEARSVSITSTGKETVSLRLKQPDNDVFTARLEQVAAGKSWKLHVTHKQQIPVGTSKTQFILQTTHADQDSLTILASIYRAPPVQAIPESILLRKEDLAKDYRSTIRFRLRSKSETMRLIKVHCAQQQVTWSQAHQIHDQLIKMQVHIPKNFVPVADCTITCEFEHGDKQHAVVLVPILVPKN